MVGGLLENQKNGVTQEGYRWIYNTYDEWKENHFPFWSVKTVQRVWEHLETMKLVITKQLYQAQGNMKKFYRIDYGAFGQLDQMDEVNLSRC